jgi:hypothetical protein
MDYFVIFTRIENQYRMSILSRKMDSMTGMASREKRSAKKPARESRPKPPGQIPTILFTRLYRKVPYIHNLKSFWANS